MSELEKGHSLRSIDRELRLMNALLFLIAKFQAKLAGEKEPSMPQIPPLKRRR